ncbi:MAG: metalloregulator ArsR/SmtB family transcription factor [Nitrospiraceae bacterium]|nr:metalloregulator ArsR/SmtB family transcription factor [Nitrospiraceae bacterium]
MPITKAKNLQRAARLFHALSDETRLNIIECLSQCEQCVCDLTDTLQSAQSRLSFHLKTLKDAGLLRDRRDGRWVYYSLNPEAIGELQEFVALLKEQSRLVREAVKCCH